MKNKKTILLIILCVIGGALIITFMTMLVRYQIAQERKILLQLTPEEIDAYKFKKRLEKGKKDAEINLIDYITAQLNDPRSFEILDKKSWIVGDSTIVVMLDFTAKNVFGGTVRTTIQAEADSKGNLTKIFDNKK